MKAIKVGCAILSAVVIAGCGGGASNAPVKFTNLVSFGDSLSDVGTYRVGTVAALGGGEYTINSPTNKIWVEDLAASLGLPAPCAAQTGLNGDATQNFNIPVTNHAGCYGYAQGGARVTNPVGPGNALLGGANATLGQLTVPVVTQIQNYLTANGGSFTGKELVTVLAGGNDVFINLALVGAAQETPTAAVTAMATAGTELAGYIKTQIIAKGANYVLVSNLPDVSKTPYIQGQSAATQALVLQMVQAYNNALQAGVASIPPANLVYVDALTGSQDEFNNPAKYGLSSSTAMACDLTPAHNPLGSSLVCTNNNLVSGTNVLTYEFSDSVHPTPYAHNLFAKSVQSEMALWGWAN